MSCPRCNRATVYHCGEGKCPRPALSFARRETRRSGRGAIVLLATYAIIAAAGLVLWAGGAFGQDFPPPAPEQPLPRCAPRSQIVYRLANQFEEFAAWQGLDERGGLVEWFGNEATGTWTIIRTTPDMEACIVSVGQGFSPSMPIEEGEPS